jgi:hypothetical protein
LSWIFLDSLVLIETFQWVTRLEAGKFFSRAFSLAIRSGTMGACGLGMRKGRIVHGASLPHFLIFSERLPSEILQKRGRLILYGWRRIAEKRSCQRSAFSRWR